ncbi:hypothetical protein [Pontibacter sp. BAB1700]|uniref:hypothetical protein n=1 Tax=Pontibacter sp. BAB1700 TaxID=1144253 RepID=UPI00026BD662|nr:hypothetical protein [Pontibacter sp. BAB1700]EJF08510.1 hypothetical protein O71_20432 [Pontibacter sp. BAB1700]
MNIQSLSEEEAAQLHQLYYALAHRVLPELFLATNEEPAAPDSLHEDDFIFEGAKGKWVLEDSLQAEMPEDAILKEAETDVLLQKHIEEQEQKRLENEAFDFEHDKFPFGKPLSPEERVSWDFDAELPDDFFEDENDLEGDLPDDFFDDEDKDSASDLPDDFFEEEGDINAEEFMQSILDEEEGEEESDLEMETFLAELEAEMGFTPNSSTPEEDFLNDTWRMAWYQTDMEELPSREGYTMEQHVLDRANITLFTFPAPFQIPDAWMAAAVHLPGEPSRYFTLEKTVGDDEHEERAVLAEWRSNGAHLNTGKYINDVTNKALFLKTVLKHLIL